MSKVDIVRAWRDEEYRSSLSKEALAGLPHHPAGSIELSDDDMRGVAGGIGEPTFMCTIATAACHSICQVFSC